MEGKSLTQNRKARHDFHIEETYEAGIVLTGTEVKSCRAGRVNLKDSYAAFEGEELFVLNMHISPYEQGNRFNHDPRRPRKLLLHKGELKRLVGRVREKGYSLVPLRLYLARGKIKVEMALARGKKHYDKRRTLAEKDANREMERALKEKQLY